MRHNRRDAAVPYHQALNRPPSPNLDEGAGFVNRRLEGTDQLVRVDSQRFLMPHDEVDESPLGQGGNVGGRGGRRDPQSLPGESVAGSGAGDQGRPEEYGSPAAEKACLS